MSTVTKVFVVLVVLASFGLLGVTSTLYTYRVEYKKALNKEQAAHGDTKKAMEDLKTKLEGDVKTLEGSLATANSNFAAADSAKQQLESVNKGLQTDLQTMTSAISKAEGSIKSLESQLGVLKDEVKRVNEEKDNYVKAKETAESERDIAQSRLNEVEGQLMNANARLSETSDALTSVARELDTVKKALRKLPPETTLDIIDVPATVEGKVMAISARPDLNLMIVNIGRNKGLVAGAQLTVFRGGKFVTKVQVEKVEGDWASARSLKDFEKMPVQIGDSVSSRVY